MTESNVHLVRWVLRLNPNDPPPYLPIEFRQPDDVMLATALGLVDPPEKTAEMQQKCAGSPRVKRGFALNLRQVGASGMIRYMPLAFLHHEMFV